MRPSAAMRQPGSPGKPGPPGAVKSDAQLFTNLGWLGRVAADARRFAVGAAYVFAEAIAVEKHRGVEPVQQRFDLLEGDQQSAR